MNEPTVTVRLHPTCSETLHTLYRYRYTRKPACEEQKVRTFHTSGRLLFKVRSSCLCSCASDRYSDLQDSISAPLIPPFSRSPSTNMWNSCMGHDRLWQSKLNDRTIQLLAYRRSHGKGRQYHTVHEVFKKLPAVPPAFLLQVEAPDFLKCYQLIVNGSELWMIGSHVLLPLLP